MPVRAALKARCARPINLERKIAIILGESEMAAGTVAIKFLRQQREQVEVLQAEIVTHWLAEFVTGIINERV